MNFFFHPNFESRTHYLMNCYLSQSSLQINLNTYKINSQYDVLILKKLLIVRNQFDWMKWMCHIGFRADTFSLNAWRQVSKVQLTKTITGPKSRGTSFGTTFDSGNLSSPKRHVLISLSFILKYFSKPFVSRNLSFLRKKDSRLILMSRVRGRICV